MAVLTSMPEISVPPAELLQFGEKWSENGGKLTRTPPCSSNQLGNLFNRAVAQALSRMLGNIPVIAPSSTALRLGETDAVEAGECRVVGGIRPQNFDVVYRPDGVRVAVDTKTLNDEKSVGKNYQNMINDLGSEATTVHTVFPYAVVGFVVAIPTPALAETQRAGLLGSLERLSQRESPLDSSHKAEAMSLVAWDPATGMIESTIPSHDSPLRIEKFSRSLEIAYTKRFKGLPPHS
jgi:hypothetical protein